MNIRNTDVMRLRVKLSLSQNDLGDILGVSGAVIYRIERDDDSCLRYFSRHQLIYDLIAMMVRVSNSEHCDVLFHTCMYYKAYRCRSTFVETLIKLGNVA